MASKKFRGPNLTLATDRRIPTIIQLESPVDMLPDAVEYDGSPESSESGSPVDLTDSSTSEFDEEIANLDRLRKTVRSNLKLRPILSSGNLRSAAATPPAFVGSTSWRDLDLESPSSSTSSVYYTPVSPGPRSAHYLGSNGSVSSGSDTPRTPRALDAGALSDKLSGPSQKPLLLDARPPVSYASSHIRGSINIVIPSLILKRCRKPAGGLQSLDALRQFVTTEQGKLDWDQLMKPGGTWNGDVLVYDETMDLSQKDSPQVPSWALLSIISPLLSFGSVDFLQGGFSAAKGHPRLRSYIESREAERMQQHGSGLVQLDTHVAARSEALPSLEQHSPLPVMSSVMSSSSSSGNGSPPPSQLAFRRPAPARRPSVPNLGKLKTKKSSERMNTLGAALPKLQLRPIRSTTLTVPSSTDATVQPHSPLHLNLAYSSHSPPWTLDTGSDTPSPDEYGNVPPTAYFSARPTTPRTPMPRSPRTARPEDAGPTTEDAHMEFAVSTILPNFLFLGPELTTPEHVRTLKDLGVRRILNIAIECDDDHGLGLKETFERYVKIPMRDTVEEENIAKGVRQVCEILDDARLHSAPTYVHCKAGKSRSVTAVMAYLIHANHWTLSRAYSFVLERRKGISPNIGFVSELMTFEEEELGGKSIGVQPSAAEKEAEQHHHHHPAPQQSAVGNGNAGGSGGPSRRPGNARPRESLPPVLTHHHSSSMAENGTGPTPMSAGTFTAAVGDSGQEMEVRDMNGRYRHVRRAPVDAETLQPMRRVSKAGLESSWGS